MVQGLSWTLDKQSSELLDADLIPVLLHRYLVKEVGTKGSEISCHIAKIQMKGGRWIDTNTYIRFRLIIVTY